MLEVVKRNAAPSEDDLKGTPKQPLGIGMSTGRGGCKSFAEGSAGGCIGWIEGRGGEGVRAPAARIALAIAGL